MSGIEDSEISHIAAAWDALKGLDSEAFARAIIYLKARHAFPANAEQSAPTGSVGAVARPSSAERVASPNPQELREEI